MDPLRLYKSLSALFAVLLVAGLGYFGYQQLHGQPVSIIANGRPITTVANAADANKLINDFTNGPEANGGSNPRVVETLKIAPLPSGSAQSLDTDLTAASKLAAALHLTVVAGLITINGEPSIALPTTDTAQQALDKVRSYYANMPPDDPIVDSPKFRESVSIVQKRVNANLVKSNIQDAFLYLTTPPHPVVYTVQRGDVGWRIARKFHIQLETLFASNADRDLNKLKAGDEINISRSATPVSVICCKRSNRDEPIRHGVPIADAGLRRSIIETTYINGAKFGTEDVLSLSTVHRAAPVAYIQ